MDQQRMAYVRNLIKALNFECYGSSSIQRQTKRHFKCNAERHQTASTVHNVGCE